MPVEQQSCTCDLCRKSAQGNSVPRLRLVPKVSGPIAIAEIPEPNAPAVS